MLRAEEILGLLESLARGDDRLETPRNPQDIFTGRVEYRSSKGWIAVVFADCNSYGGFERIEAPDGRFLEGDALDHMDLSIGSIFDRDPDLEWRVFGLGGYHRYRCPVCGGTFGPPFGMSARDREATSIPRCDARNCEGSRSPSRPTTLRILSDRQG